MRDNYRPISILPVICKIYETILYEQLTEYLENENILTDQHWFWTVPLDYVGFVRLHK